MNKKKIIIVILILITLIELLYLIFGAKEDVIVLKTNGGVPYEWVYEIKNPKIAKFSKKEIQVKTKNLPGGEVTEIYYFKGLKKGTTTITFKYKNITDNKVSKKKKYKVKVNIFKNTKIIKLK